MIPDLQLVIQMQGLDQRVWEAQQEISALPKHLGRIERALDSHLRKLEADRAALVANQKERKKLEAEIQVQEAKISKLKDQMLEARTNEQYRAFQHEIEFCQKEIRKSEDRILDLMSESEPLDQNVKAAEVALGKEKEQVEAEQQRARERTEMDRKLLDELNEERRQKVTRITPEVYSTYERLRKKPGGVAVADATEGLCAACHLALRPQFYQDLKKGEEVLCCESCHRILYYNPPVLVEEGMGAQPASEERRPPAEL